MLITPKEFVDQRLMSGLTLSRLYELIRRNHLPFVRRTGKLIWVDLDGFHAWRQGGQEKRAA